MRNIVYQRARLCVLKFFFLAFVIILNCAIVNQRTYIFVSDLPLILIHPIRFFEAFFIYGTAKDVFI